MSETSEFPHSPATETDETYPDNTYDAPAPRDVLVDGPELFPGDTGTLPLKLRQALIRLLRGPYLDAASSDNVYNTVVDNQEELRTRLSELFLTLVIDEDRKVALLRPVDMPEPHTAVLQRQREMTREETLLLLRMRLLLDRHTGTGNDAVIARTDIVEIIEGYVDPGQRDAKQVEDLADAAIRKLVQERRLLLPTEVDSVWVISGALPLALPYEHIGDIVTFMQALTDAAGDQSEQPELPDPELPEPATANDGEDIA
ncbi:DUF4194 domain-containing protein [Arthrobacter sp. zg-ZUI100]|uniref:DUF4194 domain-containing protein n=1 Tax=Arthrobacter jiangjiafuii TaxID=2817475 RepID=UPI001AEEE11F|nr:DUF4194 domain-containing protein [Arthrobacter jiangjiafuii]MBP3037524.1 DUF4194 domain-containing protein [Arthrobacter jiangjiafuii]MBP3037542.1 DUF4194 domain-containing protein [Arthrobacter jiangjiafuii]